MIDVQKLTRKKSFLKLVDAHLDSKETVYPLKPGDYLRASTIHQVCPRQEYLCYRDNVVREKHWAAKQKKTFMVGRAFECAMRDNVVGSIGILLGQWKCNGCGLEVKSENERIPKPKSCLYCLGNSFSYIEEHIRDDRFGVEGHPDGFLFFQDRLNILECKVAANYHYKQALKQPMDSHYAQVQLYMHMLDIDFAFIWYFNRETSSDLVHEVPRSRRYGELIANKGIALRKAFETGEVPAGTCTSSDCKEALKCPVYEACWGKSKPV